MRSCEHPADLYCAQYVYFSFIGCDDKNCDHYGYYEINEEDSLEDLSSKMILNVIYNSKYTR